MLISIPVPQIAKYFCKSILQVTVFLFNKKGLEPTRKSGSNQKSSSPDSPAHTVYLSIWTVSCPRLGDVMRALGQNPTESEVKKLVHEQRADDRVTFEVFLPIMQVECRLFL